MCAGEEEDDDRIMEKRKLLIAEDDTAMRELLVDLLRSEYVCIEARNGLEAMNWFENNPGGVDVVVADLRMPIMDGYELLDYIKKHPVHCRIPCLAITAYEEKDSLKRALVLGAQEVLAKPFETAILKKRIENVVELSRKNILHNVMEDIIREQIDEMIDSLGICKCPVCKMDLLTLSLNNVNPKYVSTSKGAVITKVDNFPERRRPNWLLK